MMNANSRPGCPSIRNRQRGAATLLITVIIVLLVNILTYMMTRTTTLENRMTAAELRSKQAFHAAQAGLDFALQNIISESLDTLNTTCGIEPVDASGDSPTFQLLYGREAPVCPSPTLGLQTRSFVRSIGRSADGSAVRILEVAIDLEREWISTPLEGSGGTGGTPPVVSAVISKGSVNFDGTASAAPCATAEQCRAWADQGHDWQKEASNDTYEGVLVTAGGTVDPPGGTKSTQLYPELGQIVEDPALASMSDDAFFKEILGVERTDFRADAEPISLDGTRTDINSNPNVWIEATVGGEVGTYTVPSDGAWGSPEKPIVMVVDGNLEIGANTVIWGVVYVTGEVTKGSGTAKVVGSLVTEEPIVKGTGNIAVFYNENVAKQPVLGGPTGESGTEVGEVLASFDATSWREVFF
ncbi:PilX N-terminal domain-containing pilus assembly protein [Thioalkalivibrio sp. XN279]|uniref:pilus assembly PilX family protein n=1 Tax=Thioalkalivibrio sp. XN279 TaxID=2714953 RepID=UPI00140CF7D2|nr:PilX N-terminal domain-containing pilus assembly protein [Thioalkalivibrio sp. XN279]NHA15873.1 hypothetical protein [Thioalkalivibrio sp. XN279]